MKTHLGPVEAAQVGRGHGVVRQAPPPLVESTAARPLGAWVHESTSASAGVPLDRSIQLARRLVDLVGSVHASGRVVRTLDPTTVLLTSDGAPRLRDPDRPVPIGQHGIPADAPGYRAPELRQRRRPGRAAVAEDLYGLGALLFLLATGNDPLLPADHHPASPRSATAAPASPEPGAEPPHRPLRDRLAAWLAVVARYGDTARVLSPVILGLLADDPAERLPLSEAASLLAATDRSPELPPVAVLPPPLALPTADRLLADGLDHLRATMTPDGERLWPAGDAADDSLDVQHGAAGILAVLVMDRCYPEPALEATARKAAAWLTARGAAEALPPGLHTGRAGVAWALAEAGVALREPQLVEEAGRLALRLPTSSPDPGIERGSAGIVLTHLHLAALTGDQRFLEQARLSVDALLAAAVPGRERLGFSDGLAGVGYALLAAGTVLAVPAYVELAGEAGYALCRAAETDDDGTAWWPAGGPAGIGTFLLRLYGVTGEQRFAEYARAAAGAAHRARWRTSPAGCDGLAGDGHFLLDAAEVLGDPTYRAWAEDLVPLLAARHCLRDARRLVPDRSLRAVSADYGSGLAGVLAFLLLLRNGGPRPFLADEAFADPVVTDDLTRGA